MTNVLSVCTFDDTISSSQVPVLVDFWSPNCGPCRLQEAVLKELDAEAQGQYQVVKVNVWDEPDLATRFRVSAVPTLVVFNDGQPVKTLVGYHDKSKLQRVLAEAT